MLRKVRVAAKQLAGVEPWIHCGGGLPLEFHGNEAGGWCIVSGMLGPDARVVDIGLGEDTSFSESLIKQYGCDVLGFDPTPRAIAYVRSRGIPGLRLFEYGIGATGGRVRFYLPRTPEHVSGSIKPEAHLASSTLEVELITISELMRRIEAARLDLLKMDVEGAEYDVIESREFANVAPSIDQICVEFHHRWKSRGKQSTLRAVKTLRNLGFVPVWRSVTTNEEFTFFNTRLLPSQKDS